MNYLTTGKKGTTDNENRIVKQVFTQAFDDYTLCLSSDGDLLEIGEGGSGVVYQAISNSHHRSTAVKVTGLKAPVIPGEGLDRAVLTIRLQQEAAAINPSVLAIDDFYVVGADIDENNNVKSTVILNTDNDENIGKDELHGSETILIFSFMENMEGILRRDKKKTGACHCTNELLNCIGRDDRSDLAGNPDGVLFLAYDTACALQDLKADNVAHRDVKPDNIFYDPADYRFVLGDFGLARIAEDAAASTHAGTNGFLAPEIRIGIGEYDPFSGDIYSLGMTMYALMNGLSLPGQETGMLRTNPIENIQYGRDADNKIPAPRNGFPQFNRLIKRMISSDPEKRPGIDEVLKELEDIAMDFGIYDLDDQEYRQADSRKIMRLSDIAIQDDETSATDDYQPEPEPSYTMTDYLTHMSELDDSDDDQTQPSQAQTGKRVTKISYARLPGRFLDRSKDQRTHYPTAAQVIFVLLGIFGVVTIDSHLNLNADVKMLPAFAVLFSLVFAIYQKRRHHSNAFMSAVFPLITLILAIVFLVRHEMSWQMITVIFSVILSFASADIGTMLSLSVMVYDIVDIYSIPTLSVADNQVWLIFTGELFTMMMLLFLNEKFIRGAETKVIKNRVCIDIGCLENISFLFVMIMFASGILALIFFIIYIVHAVGKTEMSVFMRLMRPQAAFGITALVAFIMDMKVSFEMDNRIEDQDYENSSEKDIIQ